MLMKVIRMVLLAQFGSFLGSATRKEDSGKGMQLGPVRVLPTSVVPGLIVGTLCGGSSLYSLLTSFVTGALLGDSLEP